MTSPGDKLHCGGCYEVSTAVNCRCEATLKAPQMMSAPTDARLPLKRYNQSNMLSKTILTAKHFNTLLLHSTVTCLISPVGTSSGHLHTFTHTKPSQHSAPLANTSTPSQVPTDVQNKAHSSTHLHLFCCLCHHLSVTYSRVYCHLDVDQNIH